MVETQQLFGKENIPAAAVSKESDTDSFLEHEKIHHNWFPWKWYND